MADQEIEGLPEGATVRPISQSQSTDIEGLPEGATVRPLTSPVAPTEKSFSERHPVVSAVGSALLDKPTGGQKGQEGMLTSFGHGMGIPTSVEEAKEAAPKLSLGGAVEAVGGPAVQAGKMIYGAAQQGTKGREEAAQEIKEAGSNILSGQPILSNIGKAGYGLAHGILQSIPFAGPLTEKAGEQVHAGNIPGAIGSGTAAVIQSLGFLKGSEAKPVDPVALEHLKILEDRLKTAQTEAVKPKKIYDAHQAIRDEGGAAPKKVVEDHEKAQANVRAAEEALAAHKRAMVIPPVPADREITPAEVEAARPEAPTPTNEELEARQNRLMGNIEQRLGMGKYAPVEPKAEPEVPTAAKPEPPPIMTAGEPERAPDMRGLKVTPEGKVIDTTAAESAAREALGVESLGRQVPATKGIAMRPPYAQEGPVEHKIDLGEMERRALSRIKPAPEVPERTEITGKTLGVPETPTEDIGAKVRAGEKGVPRTGERRERVRTPEEEQTTRLFKQARTELGENATSDQVMARVDELKAKEAKEPGLLGTEKEFKAEGLSPEDRSNAEQIVKDLRDQELMNLGRRFGLSTEKEDYDFSKRSEEGKRLRTDRDRFHKDAVAKLPEALVTHLADAEKDWNKAHPETFDPASYNPKYRAERASDIVKDAMKRYTDDLAAKGQGGGAPEEKGAPQGGHAGGGVASEEELSREGKNYVVSKSGILTHHGKSFAPEETPKGSAHVTVLPNGTIRTNEGTLSPAM